MKRRDLLGIGSMALVGTTLLPASIRAQTPKRGGTITLRLWDPPHFDPYLQVSYKTHIVYSFTHSRLVRHKVGPAVVPGTFAIEGDLAESWSQPDETKYVFKLRRGVRWQPKAPVNGRELTAEDVVYSVERFRTIKGNANASMLKPVDRVEAIDRHTVRFTLKEPYAWFLDMLANPMAACIVARECVEKFGDLRSPEATVGTGPWMFESYRPNVGMTLVRNPTYFVSGLPYIDRVEIFVDEDNASRMAAFLGGKYDLGWENPGAINRTDWVEIKDHLKRRSQGCGHRLKLNTMEYGAYIVRVLSGKHDSMGFGPYTPFLEPDGYLFFQYYAGEPRNTSIVNDPVVADLLVRQRRTLDVAKRRELIFDIQRYLVKQQYYVQLASSVYVAVWDKALRNYGPNLGFDWGGRLMAAWLDR